MNKLKLNINIFNITHVKKAVKAYKDICKIEIDQIGSYIVCEFTDCIYDSKETVNEFENYIIDLMNNDINI